MPSTDTWRARLGEAVAASGRTRAEILETAGLSRDYLRSLVEGEGNPSMSSLSALCETLNIDPAWLFADPDRDPMTYEIATKLHKLNRTQLETALKVLDAIETAPIQDPDPQGRP